MVVRGDDEDRAALRAHAMAFRSRFSLRGAGFLVVPTFRTPHVTIAFAGDVDVWIGRLLDVRSELRPNPYHEHEPS